MALAEQGPVLVKRKNNLKKHEMESFQILILAKMQFVALSVFK